MQMLRSLFLAIGNFGNRVWNFRRSLAMTIEQRRQRIAIDAAEAERLDRIRNPSKYLGK